MNDHERKMALLSGIKRRHENNKEKWVDYHDLAQTMAYLKEESELLVDDLTNVNTIVEVANRLQSEDDPLIEVGLHQTYGGGVGASYRLTSEGLWYLRTAGGRNLNYRKIDLDVLSILTDHQEEMSGHLLLEEVQRQHPDVTWRILTQRIQKLAKAAPPLCDWNPLDGDGKILDFVCSVTLAGEHLTATQKEIASEIREADSSEGVEIMDSRRVFVIHGRNEAARTAMFDWLRALDLKPTEWGEAIKMTGKTSPYIGEILEAAFSNAQAVVALMTDDEEVQLRDSLLKEGEASSRAFQARPNVIFEAGLAFGLHPKRTIIVELGNLRPFSDLSGIHVIRLDNTAARRQDFIERLKIAGCSVDIDGKTDWTTTGNFEAAVKHDPKP